MDNHPKSLVEKVELSAGTADLVVEAGVEDLFDRRGSVEARHPVLVAAADGGIAAVEGGQFGTLTAERVVLLAAAFDLELGNQT